MGPPAAEEPGESCRRLCGNATLGAPWGGRADGLARRTGREDERMSCEHLVCAACAGPVDEGRCPVCRAAHAQLHGHGMVLPPQAVVLLAVLLTAFALLA